MANDTIGAKPSRRQPSPIRVEGDTAYVQLSHGFEAMIDAADIPLIEGYNWLIFAGRNGHGYAYRRTKEKPVLFMHRHLLRPELHECVDHIDGDGLNNRRSNIRICTQTLNMANKVVERRARLGVKGVHLHPKKKFRPFMATIHTEGRTIHLGAYATKDEAAAAYKGAAKVLWGSFARE